MSEERTRIVLIRHAEAVVAVERIVGGHAGCRGLTELGRRQAEALRDRLLRTDELSDASAFCTSELPRAIETAEIIAPAVADGSLTADRRCELCELHVGEADGLTYDELIDRYGDPGLDTEALLAPGGESIKSFKARASDALRSLAREHEGRTVVAVTHGGIIFTSMETFGGFDNVERGFDLHPKNTGITIWSSAEGRWRLDCYNDAGHLSGV